MSTPADSHRDERRRRAAGAAVAWLVGTVLLCTGAYRITHLRVSDELRARATRQVETYGRDLQTALEKYETLPFVMSLQPEVARGLEHPGDPSAIEALDRYLLAVQQRARVSVAYVIAIDGATIAASNWNQPQSFVGSNYRFRPYVKSALAGSVGRFYGIGATTAEPGYFLAHPVHAADAAAQRRLIGVIAIKISLEDFEKSWLASDAPVALVDAHGIVFLSNVPGWKYRSLAPLDAATRQAIDESQQYGGKAIVPLPTEAAPHVEQPVGPLDWRLWLFTPDVAARQAAGIAAAACALLAIIGGLAAYGLHQRRQRDRTARAAREALVEAAADLERRIAARTHDLLQANQDLEQRNHELQQAEQLLRQTQNELIQAGKLGMLGQMAAGMTHELNQPLTAVRAFADNAVAFIDRGETADARENLERISNACARMGHIIGQLKGFARKSQGSVGPVDLAQAIHNSALLLRNDFMQRDASLDIRILQPACVLGDSVRVEQVLINLLRNALDAVQDGEDKRVGIELSAGERALIRIIDSGPGIAPQVREHLFEPFFTTKATGQGLGLGLAISSSIVQAMNGELSAGDAPGGGAEFVLTLPLHHCPAEEPPC